MNQTDARVRYTLMRIEQAFLKLLEDKPLNKITVTDLCRNAEINRATFYKHYLDVDDLMEKTEEKIRKNFEDSIVNGKYGSGREVITGILHHIKENYRNYAVLCGKNGDPDFEMRMIESSFTFFAPRFAKGEQEKAKLYYSFLASGSAGMIRQWILTDMHMPEEELAERIMRLSNMIVKEGKK